MKTNKIRVTANPTVVDTDRIKRGSKANASAESHADTQLTTTGGSIQIAGTFFPTQQALTKESVRISVEELRDLKPVQVKSEAPWIKLALFGDKRTPKNCLRHDENVFEVTGAELDYDTMELTFEQAITKLTEADMKTIVYTSASHTPNGPKLRVLLPFKEHFKGAIDEMKAYRKEAVLHAERVLGVEPDPASYNLSQAFYCGPVKETAAYYQVKETPGQYIDVLHDLKTSAPTPSAIDPLEARAGVKELGRGDVDRWMAGIITGEPLHPNVRDLVAHYAAMGWSRRDCRAIVTTLLGLSNAPPEKVKREIDDIERNISSAYKKFSPGPPQGIGLKLRSASEIELKPPDWIVEGYFERETVNWLYGETASMKTFILLNLALAICEGKEWFPGHQVEQGLVVYVCGEGNNGIRRRLAGWEAHTGREVPEGLYISSCSTDFSDANILRGLIQQIEALPKPPIAVIVDTFARNMAGAENEAKEISTFYRNAEHELVHRFNCAVIVAHHPGKDANRGMRGSASLKQNADSVFLAKPGKLANGTQYTILCAEKVKDARFPENAAFKAVEYEIPGLVDKFEMGVTTLAVEYDPAVVEAGDTERKQCKRTQDVRLLAAIEERPHKTQLEYANNLDVHRSTIQRTLKRLKHNNAVVCSKNGAPSITETGREMLENGKGLQNLIENLPQLEVKS